MKTIILRTKDGWEKRMSIPDKARSYMLRIAVTKPFKGQVTVTEPSYFTVDFEPTGEVLEIWEER
jgi:hypothetical protein